MKNLRLLIMLTAGIILGATSLLAVSGRHGQLESQDPFKTGKKACALCHSTHGGQGMRMWVKTPSTHTTQGRELCGSSALCYSCHDGTVTKKGAEFFNYTEKGMTISGMGASSHPVNIPMTEREGRPIWASFFTGTVGANTFTEVLTCGTCHDPHDNKTHSQYLKQTTKESLICRDCHKNK